MLRFAEVVLKSVLNAIGLMLIGYYRTKHKASEAKDKANEKVNEIHNRVRRDRAKRLRDKE